VPVGTGQKIKKIIKKHYAGDFDIASCPEFLREGTAVEDYLNADRLVIGAETSKAREMMLEVHKNLNTAKLVTNIETAEMIKYASNAFLATKISFINEIANVCESVGADVEQVAQGMGFDKRIGQHFLKAGVGYGGSCFPKDVRALQFIAGQAGYPFQLLRAVIDVNNQQRWIFYKKIKQVSNNFEDKTIGVWGLAFKANTDDIRDSISLDIIEKLLEDGAKVKVFDPVAMKNAQVKLGNRVDYCFTADLAATGVDCLLILTDWQEFKTFDLNKLKISLKKPIIFDGRNCFDPAKMKELGFEYISVGRG
jgi:UDPglucose 6-dehydrogenase